MGNILVPVYCFSSVIILRSFRKMLVFSTRRLKNGRTGHFSCVRLVVGSELPPSPVTCHWDSLTALCECCSVDLGGYLKSKTKPLCPPNINCYVSLQVEVEGLQTAIPDRFLCNQISVLKKQVHEDIKEYNLVKVRGWSVEEPGVSEKKSVWANFIMKSVIFYFFFSVIFGEGYWRSI